FSATMATALGNRLRIDINTQNLTPTEKANAGTNLGLGTAAYANTGDFATAAQGAKADSAVQPADVPALVRSTTLAGLNTGTAADITASDSVLVAFGKLQALITALQTGKQNTLTTGTTAQYFRGDLSLSNFDNDAVAAITPTTEGALINGASAKTTPADADLIGLVDSAASYVLKKLTWANLKAALSSVFQPYIATYPWATLPAASSNSGVRVRVSDVGPNGTDWISNGTDWVPVNGFALLARNAVQATVTNTLTETTLATVTIPAGLMGSNGQLRITALWSNNNSGNNKTPRVRFGGTAFYQQTVTNQLANSTLTIIRNRNATNSQVGGALGQAGLGTSAGAPVTGTI
ncbi:MAG TPA: hypothetical protein VFM46_17590, partial [Pseudomonadales bacterium]|nr:hypothetical protein [Pseudomonadales bacterium]